MNLMPENNKEAVLSLIELKGWMRFYTHANGNKTVPPEIVAHFNNVAKALGVTDTFMCEG